MSHDEELGKSIRMWNQREFAPPHWLNPFVGLLSIIDDYGPCLKHPYVLLAECDANFWLQDFIHRHYLLRRFYGEASARRSAQ